MSEKIARVAYRLDKSPVTYDFLTFLALTEKLRREQGIDKIVLALVPGVRQWSAREAVMTDARRAWRSDVLLPDLATLLPSCIGVVRGDPAKDEQTIPYNVAPYPFGNYLDGPARMQALIPFSEIYITLTVRQSWFQPERDTQPLWNGLIPQLGLPVVVVPDTEAEMVGEPCRITVGKLYAAAAFNAGLRFALYRKARLNLFTSGGPLVMATYSDLPAEAFGLHVPQYQACGSDHLNQIGLHDGRQVQNTRFHWAQDSDTILTAVRERL